MTTKIFLYLLPPQEGLPGWRECWTRRRPWRRARSERCWGQGWRPSRPCGWSQQWTRSSSGSCCSAGRWQDPSNKVDVLLIVSFEIAHLKHRVEGKRNEKHYRSQTGVIEHCVAVSMAMSVAMTVAVTMPVVMVTVLVVVNVPERKSLKFQEVFLQNNPLPLHTWVAGCGAVAVSSPVMRLIKP